MARSAFSFDKIDTDVDTAVGVYGQSSFGSRSAQARKSVYASTPPTPSATVAIPAGADIQEIENMKSEYVVAQMTLSKEQMSIFSRDIAFLRQAVGQLQEAMGTSADGHSRGHAALGDRVAFLEKDVGDSFEKHAKALKEVKGALEEHVR